MQERRELARKSETAPAGPVAEQPLLPPGPLNRPQIGCSAWLGATARLQLREPAGKPRTL